MKCGTRKKLLCNVTLTSFFTILDLVLLLLRSNDTFLSCFESLSPLASLRDILNVSVHDFEGNEIAHTGL